MRRAHPVAAIVEEAAGQNGGSAPEPDLPGDGVGGALGLHGLEQIAAEDRLMLAAMHLTPIRDLAEVEPVLEQMGKGTQASSSRMRPSAPLCRNGRKRGFWSLAKENK
jgi:hypothetical protein